MISKLVYNNKAFNILNRYNLKASSNEVTFADITIDFTDCTIADIPYKYQEISIKEAETEDSILVGNTIFTGYLDNVKLSEMKLHKEDREITLTLLSPLKMATKRSISLVGTYKLEIAIERVLQPLIDDGFTIKEINVPDGQITVNYVLETVENCMNNIGSKRNIFWTVNEKKEIFVNSIDYLFGMLPAKIISDKTEEKGLLKIQPKISNVDYANVINFKNVRLIYSQIDSSIECAEDGYSILAIEKTLKKGDTIKFDNPIIVSEDTLRECREEYTDRALDALYALQLTMRNASNPFDTYEIVLEDDEYKIDEHIGFSNDEGEEKKIVLERDSFYTNLITGLKWNGDEQTTITKIWSDTALRYTTMRFMYSSEINRLRGVISKSGQIEKTIDFQEKWTTLNQLISHARSLITQNSNFINQVELQYDINPNLKIGDTVEIDEPDFYIQGKFVVKDINYTYVNENDQDWKITLKSADLISTYIDMFRPAEKEENRKSIDTVILSEFIEETILERHTINLNKENHTLNFNL